MRDQIYDRGYQDGRDDLNQGLDRMFARFVNGVTATFDAIHRVEWSAPWKSRSDRAGLA